MLSALTGGGGATASSSLPFSGPELEALALKEWILVKWRVVQEQRQELMAEWQAACRRHNMARGLPESSERSRESLCHSA